MELKEIWKPIQVTQNDAHYDFLNKYAVSNFGRVKNIRTNYVIKQHDDKNGYFKVRLRVDGERRVHNFFVHRLVANAFILNNLKLPQVNHIDGVPHNNRVTNLEWCTPSENIQHAYRTHLIDHEKRRKACSLLTEKVKVKVKQLTLDGKLVKIHDSYVAAGKAVNVSEVAIRKCCKGILKRVAGYKWQPANIPQ